MKYNGISHFDRRAAPILSSVLSVRRDTDDPRCTHLDTGFHGHQAIILSDDLLQGVL